MKGLNLAKFKKVHEDEHSATLAHEHGHKIQIAKSSLSQKLKGQLASLPMQHLAEGGMTQDYGSQLATQALWSPDFSTSEEDKKRWAAEKQKEADAKEIDASPFAMGVEPAIQPGQAIQQQYQPAAEKRAEAVTAKRDAEAAAAEQALKAQPGEETPKDIPDDPMSQAPAFPQPVGVLEQGMKGFEQSQIGLAGEEAKRSKAEAELQANHAQQLADIQKTYETRLQSIDKERESILHDYKAGHINPNQFFDNMGGGQKVMTAIGLILGGIGSGLTGGENPVLKILNEQIDRNLKAQMVDIQEGRARANTMLGALHQQMGDAQTAYSMARVLSRDVLNDKIAELAAQTNDPKAKFAAQQAISQNQMAHAADVEQMKMRQWALTQVQRPGASGESIIRAVVPGAAEQDKYFKELKDAQNFKKAKENALAAFDEIAKINTVVNRGTSPVQSAERIESLKSFIPELAVMTGNRFTEADAKYVEKLLSTPFSDSNTIALKRKLLQERFDNKGNFPLLDNVMGVNINPLRTNAKPGIDKRLGAK